MKLKILFVCTILAYGTSIVYAGTTGKISGRITDAQSGEPLVSANVVIKGTSMGAASDLDGNYVILNIPPGTYTVVVSYLGYRAMEFQNVRVNIDLTTSLDMALTPQALEAEAVTVVAEREFVRKDMTSSLFITSSDQIKSLPVQNVQQVLRLNAGIIESDGRLHIRGGRAGEVGYWVDGISATDLYDGRMGVQVENSAVEELQVISGTYNAEYGQAMSGIVNMVTKEGGKKFSGQFKVYAGDYVSGASEFSLYNKLVTEGDPVTRLTKIVYAEEDKPLNRINPIYNVELSLGGPVPFVNDKLSFFVNGRYYYDEGYLYGRNWFEPTGARGDSSSVAMNPLRTRSLLGKLTYNLSSKSKLSYNAYWNDVYRPRNYFRSNSVDYQFNQLGQANFVQFSSRDYKYNPYGLPQFRGYAFTNTLLLSHILSQNAFCELRISRYFSESKQYVYEDPCDKRYLPKESISSPTTYSFMNKGMDVTRTERSSAYWVAKFDLTSQVDKSNQVKLGTEVRFHKLTLFSFEVVDIDNNSLNEFTPGIPRIDDPRRYDYIREPREFSAYIQDKVEFGDLIINAGLRYDYFYANSKVPVDRTDPSIYYPFKYGHIYSGVPDFLKELSGGYDSYINTLLSDGVIRAYTPDERRTFMLKKVKPKTSLSPRLGISFPITEKGTIHFSYGHFIQVPEFQYLYTNPDYKLPQGDGNRLVGNPDLKPQRTVQYEIGLQQQLTDNIGIDVTLFYKDIRNWVGSSVIFETVRSTVTYSSFENKDYAGVRGITFRFEKRMSDNYSMRADYTYQVAEGTYSNEIDAYNSMLRNEAPALAMVPMSWDQRHTFNAQITYNSSNWVISLVGRYWSGRPYTPTVPSSEIGRVASVIGTMAINSERRPDQKSVDLSLSRLINLGSRLALEIFVNIYNLLDQRVQTNVYTDTGSAYYTTTINPSKITYNANRVSIVEDYVKQPTWYSAPRQIQAGIMLDFK